MTRREALALSLALASTRAAASEPQDYPQWRGQHRDGSASAFAAAPSRRPSGGGASSANTAKRPNWHGRFPLYDRSCIGADLLDERRATARRCARLSKNELRRRPVFKCDGHSRREKQFVDPLAPSRKRQTALLEQHFGLVCGFGSSRSQVILRVTAGYSARRLVSLRLTISSYA